MPPIKKFPDSLYAPFGSMEYDQILLGEPNSEWEILSEDDFFNAFRMFTPVDLPRTEVARIGSALMHEFGVKPPVEFKDPDGDFSVTVVAR